MKKSLRLALLTAVSSLMFCLPAQALFVNGGFENGDFSGWSVTGTGAGISSVISASTPMLNGQTTDVDPYYGDYMARLQNLSGSYHSTTLTQEAALTADDLAETLYVGWGAMLVEPDNGVFHSISNQPDFSIVLQKNNVTFDSFSADAQTKQAGGWVSYGDLGGTAWYKAGVFTSALSDFSVGDILKISITVNDCGLGGHGATAFLDGIGTTPIHDPNAPVPEPATMLLMGTGLIGLVGARRRKKA